MSLIYQEQLFQDAKMHSNLITSFQRRTPSNLCVYENILIENNFPNKSSDQIF